MEFRWANVKEFWPCYVNNLEEFGFNVGPFFFLLLKSVYDMKQRFKPYKTIVLDWGRKHMIPPNKRGIKLETKLPKVRHMSRTKLVYLGLLYFILKLVLLHARGFHMKLPPTFEGKSCGGHTSLEIATLKRSSVS